MDNEHNIKYIVKLKGQQLGGTFMTEQQAADFVMTLQEDQKDDAEIVVVVDGNKELLLG